MTKALDHRKAVLSDPIDSDLTYAENLGKDPSAGIHKSGSRMLECTWTRSFRRGHFTS